MCQEQNVDGSTYRASINTRGLLKNICCMSDRNAEGGFSGRTASWEKWRAYYDSWELTWSYLWSHLCGILCERVRSRHLTIFLDCKFIHPGLSSMAKYGLGPNWIRHWKEEDRWSWGRHLLASGEKNLKGGCTRIQDIQWLPKPPQGNVTERISQTR